MKSDLVKDKWLKPNWRKIQEATKAINEGYGLVLNCDFDSRLLTGTGLSLLIDTDQKTGRGIIRIVEDTK